MFRRAVLALALLSATLSLPALAQNCDTSFTVVNSSGRTIMEIYFSPASQNSWGVDQLGTEVLAAGASKAFRPTVGGAYDFRMVFDGGAPVERRGVDICAVSTITVTASAINAQ
ncbi:hypothetical protein [Plastoroseomonas arctica]|uniref:Secreted protein n=1 Tax=Plastoroseomonas arctica TaxID=1509237 RepID=A0AAF1KKR8_9PROT|nr:hypothetical protein [Plastoroseomonas arctica]MBR0656895.1 hypothetical protein [Plastoroseomonas arctica]